MKRRIIAIARKETVQILRDPLLLMWAFGLPLVLLLLFGYAISLDIDRVPLFVIDIKPSQESRELISKIKAGGYFRLAEYRHDSLGIHEAFSHDKARVALVFPYDFSNKYGRGMPAAVQMLVDGSDNNTALIAMGYLQKIISNHNQNIVLDRARTLGNEAMGLPRIDARSRIWYNPELRSRHFIVPGLISTILGMMAVIMTALCVAREFERGTMEQLLVSPLRRIELIIGKLIPYFVIGCMEVGMVLTLGRVLFEVPIRGSLVSIAIVSMLFLVAGLGQGLLISIATRSQQVATQAALISSMLPALLLSGFMFPVSSMPKVIQVVAMIVPARHLLDMLRSLMLKGVDLWVLWPKMLFLALVGGLFLGLSYRALGKRIG